MTLLLVIQETANAQFILLVPYTSGREY